MFSLVCLAAILWMANAGTFNLEDILRSRVCYEIIGCFSTDTPFTNSWHELPSSPEAIGVTLTLYTHTGPSSGEPLDYRVTSSVSRTHFDPGAEVKVIIHGYQNNGSEAWMVGMTSALLQAGPFNVIKVSWGRGASSFYPKAVANTRVVGAVTAVLLTSLWESYNVKMSRVHLIGHSLGAHIAGYVGARVKGIGRISGLDPAGPLFEDADPEVRIDPDDADFVDCIHSDGTPITQIGFGTMHSWCDADFYPNGGMHQPGCPKPLSGTLLDLFNFKIENAEDDVSCSHSRSHDLYVDSITRCRYPATPCGSYQSFKAGACSCPEGRCPSMGYHASNPGARGGGGGGGSSSFPRGTFFLDTTGSEPFC